MDIIAGILEVIGTYLVGNKNIWCFLVNIIALILWIVFAIWINGTVIWGLLIVCSFSIIMNIRGFYKWRREDECQRKNV